jgi:formyl-CoA transferase
MTIQLNADQHKETNASRQRSAQPALAGIRVVDLSQFEAGPSCTQNLAWLGAEVIKIEAPGRGEQGRGATSNKPGEDANFFLLLNANKRSVTLNLKHPKGKQLLIDLIKKADILVENFAPGTVERLGLGYEDVRKINPRIIYAQIKGFAPEGPYGNYLAFDAIAQAAGGSLSITGEHDGRPIKPGLNVADTGAGLNCVIGILAALYQRQTTGVGQRIEVSMQDAVINFGRIAYAAQAALNAPAPRTGNQSILAGTSPSEVYPCKGGGANDYCYVYTTRAGNHHWERLLTVIGREDLLTDERFTTPKARQANYKTVDGIIAEWTINHDKRHVMKLFGEAGIPASAVFDTMELTNDPDLRKRGTFVSVNHPVRGEVVIPGFVVKLSDSHVPIVASPLLGADNEKVLGGVLGLSAAEIDSMRTDGAI